MKNNEHYKGRNYSWIFFVSLVIFSCPFINSDLSDKHSVFSAVAFIFAGAMLTAVQLVTGYSVNQMWSAVYSKTENPYSYWLGVIISVLLTLWGIYTFTT